MLGIIGIMFGLFPLNSRSVLSIHPFHLALVRSISDLMLKSQSGPHRMCLTCIVTSASMVSPFTEFVVVLSEKSPRLESFSWHTVSTYSESEKFKVRIHRPVTGQIRWPCSFAYFFGQRCFKWQIKQNWLIARCLFFVYFSSLTKNSKFWADYWKIPPSHISRPHTRAAFHTVHTPPGPRRTPPTPNRAHIHTGEAQSDP